MFVFIVRPRTTKPTSLNRKSLLHIINKSDLDKTLCGRMANGYDMPFGESLVEVVSFNEREFCKLCVKKVENKQLE